MKVKGEATVGAASLKRRIDVLSSPVALFTGKLLIRRNISPKVVYLRVKAALVGVV